MLCLLVGLSTTSLTADEIKDEINEELENTIKAINESDDERIAEQITEQMLIDDFFMLVGAAVVTKITEIGQKDVEEPNGYANILEFYRQAFNAVFDDIDMLIETAVEKLVEKVNVDKLKTAEAIAKILIEEASAEIESESDPSIEDPLEGLHVQPDDKPAETADSPEE